MPDDAAPTNLGGLIDQMYAVREHKRALEAQLKMVNADLTLLENKILSLLDDAGITMSKGRLASASVSEDEVWSLENDDEFFSYVDAHKAWHLLQRRVSNPAIRELKAMGEEVPGLRAYTKRTISLRKA